MDVPRDVREMMGNPLGKCIKHELIMINLLCILIMNPEGVTMNRSINELYIGCAVRL